MDEKNEDKISDLLDINDSGSIDFDNNNNKKKKYKYLIVGGIITLIIIFLIILIIIISKSLENKGNAYDNENEDIENIEGEINCILIYKF